ncbi:MAG: hypothetical protein A2283_06335 [Lentisphaerae bacterium RIFOXYA12_FULL_48_11]|nr:MAG: hypothetical protein A2283_06335 [Lentisphaerae bacterium RIFOXYA12_FULL_48_11]
MTETGLNPGDRVIELAGFTRSAAVIAAVISSGVVVWMAKHKAGLTAVCVIGCAIIGYAVGFVVARVLFPATGENVIVTKVGASSLPLTLKGGVLAAIAASLVVSTLCSIVMKSGIVVGLWPSLGIGLVVGIVWACLSSLL